MGAGENSCGPSDVTFEVKGVGCDDAGIFSKATCVARFAAGRDWTTLTAQEQCPGHGGHPLVSHREPSARSEGICGVTGVESQRGFKLAATRAQFLTAFGIKR